jgi:hypothetical protein
VHSLIKKLKINVKMHGEHNVKALDNYDDDNNNLMDIGTEVYAIGKYALSVLLRTPCPNTGTHYHYLLMSSSSTWHTDKEVEG